MLDSDYITSLAIYNKLFENTMIRYLTFAHLILSLFFILSDVKSQNFEGVITYKRIAGNGNIAFEKYYFKDQKLKIVSEFHNDGVMTSYESIFNFKNKPNQVFGLNQKSKIFE